MKRQIISVVLFNAIPLFGVLFLNWDPLSVFALYMIETMILGLVQVFRLSFAKKIFNFKGSQLQQGGLPAGCLVPFFILHFGMFVGIQSILIFNAPGSGFLGGFKVFFSYFREPYTWAIGAMLLFALTEFLNEILHPEQAGVKNMMDLMMRPYSRVIVQQFVVIIGGMFLNIAGLALGLVIVFVLVKTASDLLMLLYGNQWLKVFDDQALKNQ